MQSALTIHRPPLISPCHLPPRARSCCGSSTLTRNTRRSRWEPSTCCAFRAWASGTRAPTLCRSDTRGCRPGLTSQASAERESSPPHRLACNLKRQCRHRSPPPTLSVTSTVFPHAVPLSAPEPCGVQDLLDSLTDGDKLDMSIMTCRSVLCFFQSLSVPASDCHLSFHHDRQNGDSGALW